MYVELHSRSAFSFLEGSSLPEELAEVCAQLGMPAMALLDRDGVYGVPRFHLAAKKLGLRAHIGAEITFSPQRHRATEEIDDFKIDDCRLNGQRPTSSPRINADQHGSGSILHSSLFTRHSFETRNLTGNWQLTTGNCVRLPLLASSRLGYQNLCRLITRMKMRGPKDAPPEQIAATADDLAEFSPGLICLTGDEHGPLAAALARGGIEEARRAVEQFIHIFGRENVYVELQRHFLRDEEARNQAAVEIARALHLPLLATNGVSYAAPARGIGDGSHAISEREVLDVFICLRNHRTLDTAGRLLARNGERYLKPPLEMAKLFADLPQAISATEELSSRLEFTLNDLGYEFPRYPVPEGESMMSFLRQRTEEAFRERYGHSARDLRQRAKRQIERELALIEKLDLPGYFLIVWDIVRFCRQQRILVQGRGSAANSAVCYSLGITAVDPVGMDLLFERFLSEERGEWPDIDLDLPSGDQRERAIQYVYERYGQRGAAMTANVITYRGRLAAREMGKVLGFDTETLDRLSGLVGSWEYRDPSDTLERQFGQAGFDLRHPRMRKYFQLCLAVQDLPRHLGQHSGGMVICQGQLDSVVPLEPASMPGRVVVQWDKEDCADMGIIKVDLLGLGMMAVLEDCLHLIPEHYGEQVDLAHLPPDDPEVYSALQKADTIGMFQIESRAQMSCLPRLRPTNFYDIVVQVAIIRPGPIVGEMVNPYIKRRQGREPVHYPHPSLEPVLARTLGVPLFQEQLLRMAMIAAGFTGGEAEELRRAFGFKRSEARMRDIEVKLRAGMQRNGITPQAQEEIIHSITSFALYGFPESHAASFALLAYASAYLKTHYLAAFTAALLNNQPMGFYAPATIVKDAQRHGLKIKPIDVMKSEWLCTLEQWPVVSCQLPVDSQQSAFSNQHSATTPSAVGSRSSALPEQIAPAKANDQQLTTDDFLVLTFHCPLPTAHLLKRGSESIRQSSIVNRQSSRNSNLETRNFTDHLLPPSAVSPQPSTQLTTGNRQLTTVRLGLRYVKGLREEAARAIVRERSRSPFISIDDLARRVPELRKNELVTLAQIGALNSVASCQLSVASEAVSSFKFPVSGENCESNNLSSYSAQSQTGTNPVASATAWESPGRKSWENEQLQASPVGTPPSPEKLETGNSKLATDNWQLATGSPHRRDALWQVERAARRAGSLLEGIIERDSASPLARMNNEERLLADFRGTGLTVGRHPMAYRRAQLRGVKRACDLQNIKNGRRVRIAGSVIARQRPGTAHGFVFLSLEDETGIANAIITPDLFEHNRLLLIREPFLLIEGTLQNLDNVLSVKADRILPLQVSAASAASHDFR
ncbi:MAG: DNA polymerase III subunit alpha [Chlamydiota bacterium]